MIANELSDAKWMDPGDVIFSTIHVSLGSNCAHCLEPYRPGFYDEYYLDTGTL